MCVRRHPGGGDDSPADGPPEGERDVQDAAPLYTRHEGAPVPPGLGMLVALTGHMDAGRVARQVRAALHEHLTHRTVVSFDVDSMFDYRARRPRLRFDRDRYRDLRLPALEVQLLSLIHI